MAWPSLRSLDDGFRVFPTSSHRLPCKLQRVQFNTRCYHYHTLSLTPPPPHYLKMPSASNQKRVKVPSRLSDIRIRVRFLFVPFFLFSLPLPSATILFFCPVLFGGYIYPKLTFSLMAVAGYSSVGGVPCFLVEIIGCFYLSPIRYVIRALFFFLSFFPVPHH